VRLSFRILLINEGGELNTKTRLLFIEDGWLDCRRDAAAHMCLSNFHFVPIHGVLVASYTSVVGARRKVI